MHVLTYQSIRLPAGINATVSQKESVKVSAQQRSHKPEDRTH